MPSHTPHVVSNQLHAKAVLLLKHPAECLYVLFTRHLHSREWGWLRLLTDSLDAESVTESIDCSRRGWRTEAKQDSEEAAVRSSDVRTCSVVEQRLQYRGAVPRQAYSHVWH